MEASERWLSERERGRGVAVLLEQAHALHEVGERRRHRRSGRRRVPQGVQVSGDRRMRGRREPNGSDPLAAWAGECLLGRQGDTPPDRRQQNRRGGECRVVASSRGSSLPGHGYRGGRCRLLDGQRLEALRRHGATGSPALRATGSARPALAHPRSRRRRRERQPHVRRRPRASPVPCDRSGSARSRGHRSDRRGWWRRETRTRPGR